VLKVLKNADLTLQKKKCHFAYTDIRLLEHKVSRFGLSTQEKKIEAIMKLDFFTTVSEARVILEEFGCHYFFINQFFIIAQSITDGLVMTSAEKLTFRRIDKVSDPKSMSKILEKQLFLDTFARRAVFETLKIALFIASVLIHPDFSKPFKLYIDVSRKEIAAGLYQVKEDGKKHSVLFISRSLRPAEKNYAATELECLAVVWTLKKLAHYVNDAQLILVTDHSALK
jgi:RNase H-like domain found in reverse transcriptase